MSVLVFGVAWIMWAGRWSPESPQGSAEQVNYVSSIEENIEEYKKTWQRAAILEA